MPNQEKTETQVCKVKSKSFPRPMAHRVAPISVSIALGHASAKAVKATVGGWSTGSSASLTFPLHYHMSSARREGSEYHFKSLGNDSVGARTYDLPVVRQTLYHWAITPVKYAKAYGKYFLLSDMEIKTCQLTSFPYLFYHIYDLHTILSFIECYPPMSQ